MSRSKTPEQRKARKLVRRYMFLALVEPEKAEAMIPAVEAALRILPVHGQKAQSAPKAGSAPKAKKTEKAA